MIHRYLIPPLIILPTQATSALLTILLWTHYFNELYIAPPEPGISVEFGIFLSLIPIASSFLIVRFMRMRVARPIVATFQSLVMATAAYLLLLPFIGETSYLASAASLLASTLALTKGGRRLRAAFVCIFSAFASALLTISLPIMVILTLSITLAIFDLYAVFKGPLSRGIPIALVVESKHIAIGVGDMIFYALIPSVLLIHRGMASCLLALLLVDFGALVSIKLFQGREVAPGLTIPTLLTLPLFFI